MALSLRVLCLSPYHGGSHQQFVEQWIARSRHNFTLLTLPARHFKWRMRQAPVGMAIEVERLMKAGAEFDVIWTTSMLDVAEFRGLLPSELRTVPLVAYFHENQLVYPVQKDEVRDQHFSLINWSTALASTQIWFNSAFNRDSMLDGLLSLLKKMPDENSLDTLDRIRARTNIEPLGVSLPSRGHKQAGPLHIGWVGRWEHDKRPEVFFAALSALRERKIEFRLTVLGQRFRNWPAAFDLARDTFAKEIEHFGFCPDRDHYQTALGKCDVVVSTADHEFFGVALVEAVGAGAIPVVPDRLVYPEIYPAACLYSNQEGALVDRLAQLAAEKRNAGTLTLLYRELQLEDICTRFDFQARAVVLDDALVCVATA